MANEQPDFGEATAVACKILLQELMVALQKRGSLTRLEIAGALLRSETFAGQIDEAAGISNYSRIMADHVEAMERRNGLQPQLFALRQMRKDWLASGRVDPDPYDENVVLRTALEAGNDL